MLVYQQREFLIFVLRSFICGIFLGAVYDVLRILRILFKISDCPSHSADGLYSVCYPLVGRISDKKLRSRKAADVLLFISDVLFSVIAAVAVVIVAFFENDGKIRGECLCVTAVGFLSYYISVGRLTMLFSSYITFAIRMACTYLRFFIVFPIRLAGRSIKKAIMRLYVLLAIRMSAYKVAVESKKYTSYVLNGSRSAFLEVTSRRTQKRKGNAHGTEKEI
jgi:hypothetical protein